jgi:hypothetical protein
MNYVLDRSFRVDLPQPGLQYSIIVHHLNYRMKMAETSKAQRLEDSKAPGNFRISRFLRFRQWLLMKKNSRRKKHTENTEK